MKIIRDRDNDNNNNDNGKDDDDNDDNNNNRVHACREGKTKHKITGYVPSM